MLAPVPVKLADFTGFLGYSRPTPIPKSVLFRITGSIRRSIEEKS
jgi:hypothetical protein